MAHRNIGEQIDFVLRRHYSAAFTAAERACLVALIRDWDESNEHLPMSQRQRRWMEIAREHIGARWDEDCVRVGG